MLAATSLCLTLQIVLKMEEKSIMDYILWLISFFIFSGLLVRMVGVPYISRTTHVTCMYVCTFYVEISRKKIATAPVFSCGRSIYYRQQSHRPHKSSAAYLFRHRHAKVFLRHRFISSGCGRRVSDNEAEACPRESATFMLHSECIHLHPKGSVVGTI